VTDERHLALRITTARLTCTELLAGSAAESSACSTQAQKGPGSNRCQVTVLGKLFTPVVPLFTKQRNCLVAALLRVARVTAGLVECNGSLPPGL